MIGKGGQDGTGDESRAAIAFRSRRLLVLDASYNDNLEKVVRFALFTTHATTLCPFHPDVIIRVGDAAAETHACYRAKNIVKSDGTSWEREELMDEIARQLTDAADGTCPRCEHMADFRA